MDDAERGPRAVDGRDRQSLLCAGEVEVLTESREARQRTPKVCVRVQRVAVSLQAGGEGEGDGEREGELTLKDWTCDFEFHFRLRLDALPLPRSLSSRRIDVGKGQVVRREGQLAEEMTLLALLEHTQTGMLALGRRPQAVIRPWPLPARRRAALHSSPLALAHHRTSSPSLLSAMHTS